MKSLINFSLIFFNIILGISGFRELCFDSFFSHAMSCIASTLSSLAFTAVLLINLGYFRKK